MHACRSGGLYISPGLSGSRPGALIATAWAAMVGLGLEGYLDTTCSIMKATALFVKGVGAIPELRVSDPWVSRTSYWRAGRSGT